MSGDDSSWDELQRALAALSGDGGDGENGNGPFEGMAGFPGISPFSGPGVLVRAHLSADGPGFIVAMDGPGIGAMDVVHTMAFAIRAMLEQRMQAQPDQPSAPPASELVRDALPRVVVTKEDMLDASNSKCSVCLEDYQPGSHATRMLCGHLFCTSCIRDWLRTANTCPVCRYELGTDSQDYEVGRKERMKERKVRLKEGELRCMRIPDLRRLMRALEISGDGCVEKADLIGRFENSLGVEISPDQKDIVYEEDELRSLAMPFLRALSERHGLPLGQLDDLNEQEERAEVLQRFADAGWTKLSKATVEAAQSSSLDRKSPAKDDGESQPSVQKNRDDNRESVSAVDGSNINDDRSGNSTGDVGGGAGSSSGSSSGSGSSSSSGSTSTSSSSSSAAAGSPERHAKRSASKASVVTSGDSTRAEGGKNSSSKTTKSPKATRSVEEPSAKRAASKASSSAAAVAADEGGRTASKAKAVAAAATAAAASSSSPSSSSSSRLPVRAGGLLRRDNSVGASNSASSGLQPLPPLSRPPGTATGRPNLLSRHTLSHLPSSSSSMPSSSSTATSSPVQLRVSRAAPRGASSAPRRAATLSCLDAQGDNPAKN